MDKEMQAMVRVSAARTERIHTLKNMVSRRDLELSKLKQTIDLLTQENEDLRRENGKLHSWLNQLSDSLQGAA